MKSYVKYIIGGAITLVILGVVVWGRLRDVRVPTAGYWVETPHVCPGEGISLPALEEARVWWLKLGHSLVLDCKNPNVTIEVDPTIDTRDSVEDLDIRHGLTNAITEGSVIRSAKIRVLPNTEAIWLAHELGHMFGYLHPWFCPTGHMMRSSNIGWNDSRGLTRTPPK